MPSAVFLALFLLLGNEVKQSHTIEVHVLDSRNKLCLYANLMVTFNVTYEAYDGVPRTVQLGLPSKVDSSGSSCSNGISLLKLRFGNGHSWGMVFERANHTYKVERIFFTYNLKDDDLFQNSAVKETRTVSFNGALNNMSTDTYYHCRSELVLSVDDVTQTMWNISLQAFVNGSRSDKDVECEADKTRTTPVTALLTTSRPVAIPSLAVGNYSVAEGLTGNICLLATMGLQIQYKDQAEFQSVNLDPSRTRATGSCGFNGNEASLLLSFGKGSIAFTFLEERGTFHLHAVNVSIAMTSGVVFHAAATNLYLWVASVGTSFMCEKELTQIMTKNLSLCTVNLRVQPFAVQNGAFATALDCVVDDARLLIPEIVGATLGALIFILIVAFLVTKKKSPPGYQAL